MTVFVVGVGGALGAIARYLGAGWVQAMSGSFFPWGTWAVNVLGSAALGFALVWLRSTASSSEVRDLVTIGFLGSFTTFSAFSYESVVLVRDGEWTRAGFYVAISVVVCLIAVMAGMALAAALGPGGTE